MWRERAFGWCLLWVAGCGGGQPPAGSADRESAAEAPEESASEATPPPKSEGDVGAAAESDKPPEAKAAEVAEPVFTENMSVAQAQAAIPQGTPRSNLEQEALAKPLQEPTAFEACKIGNAHFQVKVAIWNGKAVGVDLTTKPKNPKLAECLTARIRELNWPDRVRSLNTVEFQY